MAITVENLPPLAVIAGPTASGKSALALSLAERSGGVLVNADSAQLYRDLPLLSAAPTKADRERVEHRLYGVVDGGDSCSAADWAAMARREIADVHSSGRLPILVGGTGLYIRILLDGIAPVPAVDSNVRAEVRAATVEQNRVRLGDLDPQAAASLNAGDTSRIARALEVILSTGKPLAAWQAQREGGIGSSVALRPLLLLPPRDWLYRRCDARFETMVDQGAATEVKALLARKLSPDLPIMRAIGVREIADWLNGESSREEAIARGRQSTRHYAKRQYTWFANQPPSDWPRFAKPLDDEAASAEALELLGGTA